MRRTVVAVALATLLAAGAAGQLASDAPSQARASDEPPRAVGPDLPARVVPTAESAAPVEGTAAFEDANASGDIEPVCPAHCQDAPTSGDDTDGEQAHAGDGDHAQAGIGAPPPGSGDEALPAPALPPVAPDIGDEVAPDAPSLVTGPALRHGGDAPLAPQRSGTPLDHEAIDARIAASDLRPRLERSTADATALLGAPATVPGLTLAVGEDAPAGRSAHLRMPGGDEHRVPGRDHRVGLDVVAMPTV